jgi:hypothetical protein
MQKEITPIPPAIDFPKSLLPVVDKVVAHVVHGSPLPKNLNKLIEWFEEEGWDDLCLAWAEEFVALKLFEMAWLSFSDQELIANQDEPISVTDEVRLTYARELVSRAFEESDGYACPTVHAVQISNKQGQVAILGWLMPIHGQGGPVAEFQGVFLDKSQFYQSLRDADYVLATEEKSLKDETILRLWAKPSKPTRNVTVSVAWGNELHDCPMSQRTWQRVLSGKTLRRVESFFFEGKRFKAEWMFNYSGFGSLLVTYGDEAVGFDGSLSDAQILVDDEPVVWSADSHHPV